MTTAGTVLFSRSDVEKRPEPRRVRATTAGAVAWRSRDAEPGGSHQRREEQSRSIRDAPGLPPPAAFERRARRRRPRSPGGGEEAMAGGRRFVRRGPTRTDPFSPIMA